MASTVGKGGAVVIPAELRQRFGLDEGTEVVAEARADGVLVRPVGSAPDRHRLMLEETNRAYEALRADPNAWREELAERALWDATPLDGLDPDEQWTEDGGRVGSNGDDDQPDTGRDVAGGPGPNARP